MATLTIARGLVQLKTLDKKIDRLNDQLEPLALKTGDKLLETLSTEQQFCEAAKSTYQSLIDTIAYRSKLRAAIIKSNAVTEILVGETRMTVAEAIELKTTLAYKRTLCTHLQQKFGQISTQREKLYRVVEANVEKLIEAFYQNKDSKPNPSDYETIAGPYRANNTPTLIDPLDIQKKVIELQTEIDAFEENVDIVLSESNARTEIDID